MHQSVPFPELIALYAVSDACIVASTRDGMNLVSFEYIACQQQRNGSLILSEFAGSAKSLTGAIIVNPWNIHDMARAMDQAYHMPSDERKERFDTMEAYVQTFTRYLCVLEPYKCHNFRVHLTAWADSFLQCILGEKLHRCADNGG